jgi:tRNA U34 5-methylaminomethyl-2-thiouridine-forming methyltransferase MnmC
MKKTIVSTADGSSTIFLEALNEHYHSHHGAIQEARHVFIFNGFEFMAKQRVNAPLRILEVGFGTGLNALLTVLSAKDHDFEILYHGLEAFPVDFELLESLNYKDKIRDSANVFNLLHNAPWEKPITISPNFSIFKNCCLLEDFRVEYHFDIVYYDAFGPRAQSEMWSKQTLQKVVDVMQHNGVFVTYCAKGQLKRDLKELGMIVETLPGPPGKREMVRAIKI